MCEFCLGYGPGGHDSRCPNAPDPVPVRECHKCGGGIYEGDEFAHIDGVDYCYDCIDDMPYIRIAVRAAEQIFVGSGLGAKKKEYVLQWLADHNITVDLDKVDAMIESAVYDLNLEQYMSDPIYAGYPIDYYYGETEGTCDSTEEDCTEEDAEEPDEAAPAEETAPAEEAAPETEADSPEPAEE